jgi:nucleoside triphosphate diphosphatase
LGAVPEPAVAAAVARLDELTRRLRRECPWDREQDERSIVPHTVEEAYELAAAANTGDDAKLLDELGDVLFQVHFLSLLLEERGAGDLAGVAEHCRAKLIRRHPHVFGDAAAATAGEVLRTWDEVKRSEPGRANGIFGDVPENLPALLHARKVQRRAASTGFDFPGVEGPLAGVEAELGELAAAVGAAGIDAEAGAAAPDDARAALFHEVGDVLFAAVNVARKLRVDPELALRSASARFRARIEAAERLAADAGETWGELPAEHQLSFYAQARLSET